jgi:two-component system, cell cycle sensor histidine kinase and response regulator CckA
MTFDKRLFWRYLRGLAAPLLLWTVLAVVVLRPVQQWLSGAEAYDVWLMREWLEESRVWHDTLREMARDYLDDLKQSDTDPTRQVRLLLKAEKIRENLKALGIPPKQYSAQLPSFPVIYSLELSLDPGSGSDPASIVWDSLLARHQGQYRELEHVLFPGAVIKVRYQLHAYNTQQRIEQANARRIRWIAALTGIGTLVALVWVFLTGQRERERQLQHALAQKRLHEAEQQRLQAELRQRGAESQREEAERNFLEQRLATQAAQASALELKSQLYASIGIMAGSYAHNIKNLLVRPNDLLRRCLEDNGLSGNQERMLLEVRQTLATVTERLQQILRTVRRDPTHPESANLDLNDLTADLVKTWKNLATEKWKLCLELDLAAAPLPIQGDLSHLQQAFENLLFNARDATFEMRNRLRDEVRSRQNIESEEGRNALIAAAAWRGSVYLRTCREGDRGILEVKDNGIGMSEEVRRRCTETHFSTKRDNAIYEGHSTGMGLGLSFVLAILEHHQGKLEIESEPMHGTTLRVSLPLRQ